MAPSHMRYEANIRLFSGLYFRDTLQGPFRYLLIFRPEDFL
jgi:hypothetical protein